METLDAEEDDNLGSNDHLSQVLGGEHSGRVRCRPGKNIVPTRYWGTSSASQLSSNSDSAAHAEAVRARSEAAEVKKMMMEERERNQQERERQRRANEEFIKAMRALQCTLPPENAKALDACLLTMSSVYDAPSGSRGQDVRGDGDDECSGQGVEGDRDDDGDDSYDDDGDDDGDGDDGVDAINVNDGEEDDFLHY